MRDRPKFYCIRRSLPQSIYRNSDVMECSVPFTVDRNIFILGVEVPSQVLNDGNFNLVSLFIIICHKSH